MDKRSRTKWLVMIPVLLMAFFALTGSRVFGEGNPMSENRKKIEQLDSLRVETLQKLFAQKQKIEALSQDGKKLAHEIEDSNKIIADLQGTLDKEKSAYAEKRENLRRVLLTYQRMGPGSYLEMLLESKDLSDFLKRLGVLGQISSNTEEVLKLLKISEEQQALEEKRLKDQLAQLLEQKARYEDSLANEERLKKELDDELASLAAEQESYQAYLADMQQKWNAAKGMMSDAVRAFSDMTAKGDFPPDLFKVTMGFLSLNGSVTDQALNETLMEDPAWPEISFVFEDGAVRIMMPESNLSLDGSFVVQGGRALRFQADEADFFGVALENSAIQELFQEGGLIFDLSPLLGNATIRSVETKNGSLQISIFPGFLGGDIHD